MKTLLSYKTLSRSLWVGLGMLACLVLGTQTAKAAVFNPVDGAALLTDLATAATNTQDDVINLAPGTTYATGGNTFTYIATNTEAFSLTIQGTPGEAENTILDGGLADQVLFINTTNVAMPNDFGATISLMNFSIINGADVGDGAGLEINANEVAVIIDSVLFSANEADDDGGAADIDTDGVVIVTNSIFDSNVADADGAGVGDGGCIYVHRDISHLNTVFVNNDGYRNSAADDGGCAYLEFNDPTATGNVYNNVFFLNEAVDPGNVDSDVFFQNDLGAPTGSTLNIIDNIAFALDIQCLGCGTITQTGTLAQDPLFVDPANGDFNLQVPGSPAIDSGDDAAPNLPATDFFGNPRVMGLTVDRGAIETPVPMIVAVPSPVDFGDIVVGDSTSTEVTITNQGLADLNVSAITLSDLVNFSLDVNGGTTPCGATPTLAPAASCTVLVGFAPGAEQVFNADLTITSNDPLVPNVVIPVVGTGIASGGGTGGVNVSGSGCTLSTGPVSTNTALPLALLALLGLGVAWRVRNSQA